MPRSSGNEADIVLAQALSERDHGEQKRAVETLKRVIVVCEDSDTGTCQYLARNGVHHPRD